MRFLKITLALLLGTLYFFLSANSVFAEGEFLTDSKVEYSVSESGKTLVTHEIDLENAFSTLYATSYTLTLENIDSQNVVARYENGLELDVQVSTEGEKTNVRISFPDPVVGKGKIRKFFVSYENSSFAVRTGEVWEISIPKLASEKSFRNYEAVLKVPVSLGLEAYVSPKPSESTEVDGYRVYRFEKNDLTKTGVSAGFGQFQVFNFTLNYHLENPLSRRAETEIAIPPDTAFQKVYIRSLIPSPSNVRIDEDGNWLAIYSLSPRERVDVIASGEVQIFSSNRSFPKPTSEILSRNLKETSVWQTQDADIRALAQKLRTPKAIYDYVSTTLKYDYSRVRPNVERLGARGALLAPSSAICMEFTDLFIAIARAAGIPAREINGFAYTENPDIQPLGLVADVLHSWPEYWDDERKSWIPIDPTWASTTGGVDFFDKLDLRHFTFVIHGENENKPYPPGSYKLGTNPQKDVFVSFGKLSLEATTYPEVSANLAHSLPFFDSNLTIKVTNSGPTAFYSLYPTVFFDDREFFRDFDEVLPPFGNYETKVKIPYSFLGKSTPTDIRVVVDGSTVSIPTNKNGVIITSLAALFLVFIIILITLIIRMRWTKNLLNPYRKVREFISSKLGKNQSISGKP